MDNVVIVPQVLSSAVNPTSRQFSLSWTNNGGSYVLQQTFSLIPPQQWITVTNAPLLANGFFGLTLPATNEERLLPAAGTVRNSDGLALQTCSPISWKTRTVPKK